MDIQTFYHCGKQSVKERTHYCYTMVLGQHAKITKESTKSSLMKSTNMCTLPNHEPLRASLIPSSLFIIGNINNFTLNSNLDKLHFDLTMTEMNDNG